MKLPIWMNTTGRTYVTTMGVLLFLSAGTTATDQ